MKANINDVNLMLSNKAEASEMAAQLALKADNDDLAALRILVDSKADADDVTLLTNSVAAKADLTDVTDRLTLKAEASAVEEVRTLLGAASEQIAANEPITVGTMIAEITPLLDAKADVTFVNTELASRVDDSALTLALADKADLVDLTTVRSELEQKAASEDVADLTTLMNGKADGTAVDALTDVVAGKADGAVVTAELQAKATVTDVTLLRNIVTQNTADVSNLTTTVAGKADFGFVNAALKNVTALLGEPDVSAEVSLGIEVDTIAEGTAERERFEAAFRADLALVLGVTADQITIDSISPGSVVVAFTVRPQPEDPVSADDMKAAFADPAAVQLAGASAQGLANVAETQEWEALSFEVELLWGALADKANSSIHKEVTALKETMKGKANTSQVIRQLELKADISNMSMGLADKAGRAELSMLKDNLTTQLSWKAATSGLDALQRDVTGLNESVTLQLAAKANGSDVSALKNAVDGNTHAITNLSSTVESKADGSDLFAMNDTLSQRFIDIAAALTEKAGMAEMLRLLADKMNSSVVFEQLENKVEYAELYAALMSKANVSTVETMRTLLGAASEHIESHDPLTIGEVIEELIPRFDAKADLTFVNAALSGKADLSDMATWLASKVDADDLASALAAKAAAADVVALQTAMAGKVDTSEMTLQLALKADGTYVAGALATKAGASDVMGLQIAMAGKVDAAAMATQLALKADQTYVAGALADKASSTDVSTLRDDLTTQLSWKAATSNLDALQRDVMGLNESMVSRLGAQANGSDLSALKNAVDGNTHAITNLSSTIESKADGSDLFALNDTLSQRFIDIAAALTEKAGMTEMLTLLADKMNSSVVFEQLENKVEYAELYAALMSKANASTVETMRTLLGAASEHIESHDPLTIGEVIEELIPRFDAKADLTFVNAALSGKADLSDMATWLASKVDADDLASALAAKAAAADVVALQTAMAGKVDTSEMTLQLALKADGTYVADALEDKAGSADVSALRDNLTTQLSWKAATSSLDSLERSFLKLNESMALQLAAKANGSDLSALKNAVDGNTDAITNLSGTIESKADGDDLTALTDTVGGNLAEVTGWLDLKADTTDIFALNDTLSLRFIDIAAALTEKAGMTEMLTLLADKVNSSVVFEQLENKVEYAELYAALMSKANASTVETMRTLLGAASEHIESHDPLTIGNVTALMIPLLDDKAGAADLSTLRDDLTTQLSWKAATGDLEALQRDFTGLNDEVALQLVAKANGSDLTSLKNAVDGNTHAITNLSGTIESKADGSDLTALTDTIGGKASLAEMTAALRLKANTSALATCCAPDVSSLLRFRGRLNHPDRFLLLALGSSHLRRRGRTRPELLGCLG
eukprot:COSAG04_NODE_43_length_31842_cov_15.704848_19_plen_1364_part_00